jgi:hypothetical protein
MRSARIAALIADPANLLTARAKRGEPQKAHAPGRQGVNLAIGLGSFPLLLVSGCPEMAPGCSPCHRAAERQPLPVQASAALRVSLPGYRNHPRYFLLPEGPCGTRSAPGGGRFLASRLVAATLAAPAPLETNQHPERDKERNDRQQHHHRRQPHP